MPRTAELSLREIAWVGGGAAGVTLLYLRPLVRELTTSLPDNPGDAVLNAWVLAWGADRLRHGLHGFWSPPILYPYENTLAYSENLLGITVLVSPVQWLFGNPTLTYNVALLLSFVLAAVGAYGLARELTARPSAALVAACAFAFAPYRWAQLSHLQVLSVGWLPLALWAMHRALRSPSLAVLLGLVAAVLLQAFSYGYSVFQMALALAIVACWCTARSAVARATFGRLAAAVLVLGILLSPAIAAHYRVWSVREPFPGDLTRYSADVGSYLDLAPGLPLERWLPDVPQDEGRLFPGAAVTLLAAVALIPIPRRWPVSEWRWLYFTLALLAIVISLGPEPRAWGRPVPIPPIYAWLLATVPLFDALRVPARFGMLAVLAFASLAAMGAARIVSESAPRRTAALAATLGGIILWEGYGGPLVVRPNALPEGTWNAVYSWLARQPPGAIVNLPPAPLDRRHLGADHQYAALVHRHPTVDGVSRVETPLQSFLAGSASPLFDPALLPEAVPFLRGLRIRYLLVRPDDFTDRPLADRLLNTLDHADGVRPAARFEGGALKRVDHPVPGRPENLLLVYEISPVPAAVADTARLRAMPAAALRLTASHRPNRLALAIDGDPHSRWTTGQPQRGDEWVAVEFDRPRDVARLDFRFSARSVRDYPRRLEIRSGGSGEPERTLYTGSILAALGGGWVRSPDEPLATLNLPPHRGTRLELRQVGRSASWYWSIDEFVVWERR